jgi:hypothetical protein
MTNLAQLAAFIFRRGLRAPAFAMALLCALIVLLTQPAQAQTLTVLHTFQGTDGGHPPARSYPRQGRARLWNDRKPRPLRRRHCV